MLHPSFCLWEQPSSHLYSFPIPDIDLVIYQTGQYCAQCINRPTYIFIDFLLLSLSRWQRKCKLPVQLVPQSWWCAVNRLERVGQTATAKHKNDSFVPCWGSTSSCSSVSPSSSVLALFCFWSLISSERSIFSPVSSLFSLWRLLKDGSLGRWTGSEVVPSSPCASSTSS